MQFTRYVPLAPLIAGLLMVSPAVGQVADQIWSGGPVVTINDAQPVAQAVAVKDGRILAVGSSEELQKHRGDQTQMMDLKGRAMLPGFVDAHEPIHKQWRLPIQPANKPH